MTRYRVRHVTTYKYDQAVDLGRHMLHLTPRALGWQVVVAASLVADPVPTRRDDGVDHFGNPVTWMALDQPHARFRLSLEAVVEVGHPAPPVAEGTWAWEQVAAAGLVDWQAAEFAFGSPLAPADAGAGALVIAAPPRGTARDPRSGRLVSGRFRRDPIHEGEIRERRNRRVGLSLTRWKWHQSVSWLRAPSSQEPVHGEQNCLALTPRV